MASEKKLERKLRETVKKKGGLALKFAPFGMIGMPDRILLLPRGRVAFAELKSTGKKLRPAQLSRISFLVNLGFTVGVIDTEDKLIDFLQKVI